MYEPHRLPGTGVPLAAPAGYYQQQRGSDVDPVGMWNTFVGTVMRRRWLFLIVFLGIVAAVAIVTLLTPKRYTTETKLIAGSSSSTQNSQQMLTNMPILNALQLGDPAQSAETYSELFTETPVVKRVIEDLNLKTDVRTLQAALKVKPVTNTKILVLSVTWSDPKTSAAIANDFAGRFMARQYELVYGQASGALKALGKQIPEAQNRLLAAEKAVSDFEISHNIADLGTQTSGAVNAANTVDAKINAIQLEKQMADAQVASLSAQLAGMQSTASGGSTTAQNPVLPQLRQQLAQKQVDLGTAQQQYTDEHPTVVAIKRQIADLKKEIARQPLTILQQSSSVANPVYQQLSQQLGMARAMSLSDSHQLGTLASQRAAINPLLASLPKDAARLAELKRNQKFAEDLFTALQQKASDATVSRATEIGNVTVTQEASWELATKTPHLASNLMLGTVIGLLIALGIVFLVEWFDGRIRDERDVENELQLPVLASVPELPSGDGAAAAPLAVRNAALESYFQLVLAMRYSSDKPLRTVTITSPLKGDGKSTIAMNVASAFGEIAVSSIEREARVLIIDADMRRPSLHRKFEVSNELGLSDILIGRASLTQAVQRTDRPGVDVLTSGAHSPNPIKLLQSSRFDALLREARERYVTVIVDAPALVPVYDAAIVAAKTDGTVMILSAGHTDMRSTRKALARLEGVGVTELVGTVMNRSTTKVEDYSDYFAVNARELKELPQSA